MRHTSINCFYGLVENAKCVIIASSFYKNMRKSQLVPNNRGTQAGPELSSGDRILAASVALCSLINDKVLVVRRAGKVTRNQGKYELPGGKLDWSRHLESGGQESRRVEDDILRELREEIGITLTEGTNDLCAFDNAKIHEETGRSILAFRYVGIYPEGQQVVIPKEERIEHDSYKFVNAATYHGLEYISGIKEFLDQIFERQRLRGTLLANTSKMFTVHCIFVDPVTKNVLFVRDKAPQSSEKAGYRFPNAAVNMWEHLHHTVQRIVRVLSQLRHTSKLLCRSEQSQPSCKIRRVAILPSYFKVPDSEKVEKVWNFYYLVYVPRFAETLLQAAAAERFEYDWRPADFESLMLVCSQLQTQGDTERLHFRESITKIVRTIRNLRVQRSMARISSNTLGETQDILDDNMK